MNVNEKSEEICGSPGISLEGHFVPNDVRYQAALHSDIN